MTNQAAAPHKAKGAPQLQEFDALVIGAGFAGLGMLHHLRELGLDAKVFDAGGDLGGTWYWNCYPGARTDSECYYYCFSFSPELLKRWQWSERYPAQQETLRYLNFVADTLNLRRDIQFNTGVTAATWDEERGRWLVHTDSGEQVRCRFLISGMGYLSEPYTPNIEGLERFEGEMHHTARWPKQAVDFSAKRVGIIGAGATTVQMLPIVAESAEQFVLFQRTPNYVLPAGNRPMTADWASEIQENYAEIWHKARRHFFAAPLFGSPTNRLALQTSPEEREAIFSKAWEDGGFRFVFETFDDLLVEPEAADMAAEFVRCRIRETVKKPATVELLQPTYPFFAKRVPLGHNYYETFNLDHVTLVDIARNEPIEAITAQGVRTTRADYELDMLVLATGFDAVTGAFGKVDIRGKGGRALKTKWDTSPSTFLGLCTRDFPNLFMITGPQSPFANLPVLIEENAKWIQACIRHMLQHELDTVEPEQAAEEAWTTHCNEAIEATQLRHGRDVGSWFVGANITGKSRNVLSYFGGADDYLDRCDASRANGFEGLRFGTMADRIAPGRHTSDAGQSSARTGEETTP